MSQTTHRVALFVGLMAASAALVLPVRLFQDATRVGIMGALCGLIGPYAIGLAIWTIVSASPRAERFLPRRSFERTALVAFLCTLPMFVTAVGSAVFPHSTMFLIALSFGMQVSLLTLTPLATIDHPTTDRRGYWQRMAMFGSILMLIAGASRILAHGPSHSDVCEISGAVLGWPTGLFAGLVLGGQVNRSVPILRNVYHYLKSRATPILAFGLGYIFEVVIFAGFYAAVWRVQQTDGFSGFSAAPQFFDFLYFSVAPKASGG